MSDVVADLTIEAFAQSELELLERVAILEADVGVYRELALVAFDIVHDLTQRNRALVITRARMRQDVLNERWAANAAAVDQSHADDQGAA